MRLCDIISEKAVLTDLAATDKDGVIRELVDVLVKSGSVTETARKKVVAALMAREELGSTGIGQGIAVPHAKHESVEGLVGAFGRSKAGIEFDALDGEPVHLVFLLLSNRNASGSHLEALAHISRILRDDVFCRFLRRADTRDQALDLLREADEKQAAS